MDEFVVEAKPREMFSITVGRDGGTLDIKMKTYEPCLSAALHIHGHVVWSENDNTSRWFECTKVDNRFA